jgi:hypothetical protein
MRLVFVPTDIIYKKFTVKVFLSIYIKSLATTADFYQNLVLHFKCTNSNKIIVAWAAIMRPFC